MRPTQARRTAKGPFTVAVPNADPPLPGESAIYRNPMSLGELPTRPHPDVSTTYEIVQYAAKTYGDSPAMGTRKLLKTHSETKKVHKLVEGRDSMADKTWVYFELGPYEFTSYREYATLVDQVGAGLKKLGLRGGKGCGDQADKVHIYAATSMHWLCMSHAAASRAMPFVTAYDTLGQEGLKHSLVETGSKAIFLDPHLLPSLAGVLGEAKDITHVVWNSQYEASEKDISSLKDKFPRLNILSFEELRRLGEENPCEADPPGPEDLCCIMYTSGSTGKPKGVELLQRNISSALAGLFHITKDIISPGDRILTYLPLAHILEFCVEHSALYNGIVMGYGNPKTLSDTQVRNCSGDIKEFAPHILAGVPAVFESIKKGIVAKVSAGSVVLRGLFWGALALKSRLNRWGLPGVGILDAIVFKKIREAVGGNLILTVTGGAPISSDTQDFISNCIAPLIAGYGLTETACVCTMVEPPQWTLDTVGALYRTVEMKLVDYPEAGYRVTNRPRPQGELLFRGPVVSPRYYKNEAETAAAFTADGWFRTGDIGEILPDGHVRIIDRKKNLVKSLNGEYIALEKLEAAYRASPLVLNLCVYADAQHARPVAVVVPAEPALKAFAAQHGIHVPEGEGIGQMAVDHRLQTLVLESLQKLGREAGLVGIEIISGVVLSDEEWTPQNGMTTAAMKLNRRAIVDAWRKQIDAVYAGSAKNHA